VFAAILPSEKVLPAKLNMELIRRLQTVVAPQVFTPRAVYDGRKNMFSMRELPFGSSQEASQSPTSYSIALILFFIV
jgi:eukaryotic translation initiation factor 2C